MTPATLPTSRPLRALVIILGGWTTMRVVVLWPGASVAELPLKALAEILVLSPTVVAVFDTKPLGFATRLPTLPPLTSERRQSRSALNFSLPGASPFAVPQATLEQDKAPGWQDRLQPAVFANVLTVSPLVAAPPSRISGSMWALMRGDGATSLASSGQLGGSQTGARIYYTPGSEALSLTARVSAPLSNQTGREVAVGMALRGRNIGIIAERRFSLDKLGRDTAAVLVYGGVSDVKLSGKLMLNGYAQAGIVGLRPSAAFIDGAVHIERTVIQIANASLSVGAGVWGGAQPGVSRIDIGPQIVARIAVAKTNLRVSSEWRQRVAGTAIPASGLSVTVGFDF